jgi:hypothetical protein
MKAMTAVMIGLTLIGTQSTAQIRRGRAVTGGRIDETTRIINDCERRTNSFKKTLDRALARDNVRAGEGRENQLNNNASRLENELDKECGHGADWPASPLSRANPKTVTS